MKLFSSLTATQRGIAISIASAVVYGLWPVSVRGIYQEDGNASFALITTLLVRTLSMVGFCLIARKKLFASRKGIQDALTGGISQAICLVALFSALKLVSGPIVIIIVFTHTLMLLLFMVARRETKMDLPTFVSSATALTGLAFVLDVFSSHAASGLIGYGLAFIAALATVSRIYVFGKQTAERHPIVVGAECFVIASCCVALVMLYEQPVPPHSFKGWSFTALGSLSLTLGTFGMFYGISLLGAFRWSMFGKLEPIFTSLFSALLIGETLKLSQYLGIGIVIASLVAYQVADSRKKARIEAQKQMLAR